VSVAPELVESLEVPHEVRRRSATAPRARTFIFRKKKNKVVKVYKIDE